MNKEDYIKEEDKINENKNNNIPPSDSEKEIPENDKVYQWLAGIIDGDGCFLVSKVKLGKITWSNEIVLWIKSK